MYIFERNTEQELSTIARDILHYNDDVLEDFEYFALTHAVFNHEDGTDNT